MRRTVTTLTCAGLLLLGAGGCAGDEGTTLVTDGSSDGTVPANTSSITLAVPQAPAPPHCLLSDGLLVVWPGGSTYDVANGEVHDRDGDLLGRVGESVSGGGALSEPSSSDTLEDVDWAGCTPTGDVLHQYG
ncbi:hypothetical protein [Kineococcus sp. SYSU DK018]|uniref:hypothetical protein n=1 Tax=Kineococcus sp. SYSU DK018 TaxID=3383139 RepID=UPI003D7D5FC2